MRPTKIQQQLSGTDGPGRTGLPAGEFLQPIPVVAVLLLAVNDHWLKGAGVLPGWLTGKLSDIAGLLFFPLLCTAIWDLATLVFARAGVPCDFSLRPTKLRIAVIGTGVLFIAIKTWNPAAETLVSLLSGLGFHSRIVVDPTDLLALPALLVAYRLGVREIAQLPLGRLEVIRRACVHEPTAERVLSQLSDVRAYHRRPDRVCHLAASYARYLETGDSQEAQRDLDALRARE